MRQFFLALFALSTLASCAQKTTSGTTDAAPLSQGTAPAYSPKLSDTTLLWKITGEGTAAPSYLFGTIHMIPEEDYFLPNRVVAALNESEEVVFEIDPRDMQDPSKMMGLLTKINMRNGTTLKDLLTAEKYAEVKAHFDGGMLPFQFLERMKPLFVSAMVGQDLEGMGMGGFGGGGDADGPSGIKSYELELTELAEAADKPIGGLETMEFQMSMFDSIDYEVQAEMLHKVIVAENDKETNGGLSEMDRIVALYRRQAVAEMATMMSEETQEASNVEELLLTRRNLNWSPIIQMAITEKPTFYAVGAGHLGGEKGVIALLREAGLKVEPVF